MFLAIKIWRVKGSVRQFVTVVGMLASGAAVMGIALPAQRYAAGGFDVRTINALLHVIEVLVLLAQ